MKYQHVCLTAMMAIGFGCGDSDQSDPVELNNINNAENNQNNLNNANNENNLNNAENNLTPTFTYYQDVKPLLDGRCVGCHTENGIGPFALETFEQASSVSQLIKTAVVSKTMPPFLPDDADCQEMQHDPSLSDDEIAIIETWVDEGAAMGDPENEAEPMEEGTFVPPVFDTELVMAEAYTPAKSPDDYRCFVVDWPHDTQKFITGFGVVPGEPSIVHHIIAFLAAPDVVAVAEQNDANDPGPGYECFGEPNLGNQNTAWLGSWAPGGVDNKYPEGTGLPIQPGSKVVIQVHYNTLTTEAVPDLSQVRFETTDSVEKAGQYILWAHPNWFGGGMNIPAGNDDVVHTFSFDPTAAYGGNKMTFYGGALHMHLLGTQSRTWINRQGGGESCLIDIPRWDFNWQANWQFKEPVELNKGDSLSLECHWDNSMANQPMVDGRRLTPEDRSWGDGSTDEMCLGVYYVTID